PYVYEYSVWDSDYRHVLNAFSLTANAKLMVPAGDGFRPYLLVGGGYGWVRIDYDWPSYFDEPSSSTDDGGFGRAGIGFDYFSTAGIGLECEATYNCGFGDISDFRYVALQAGIVVLFGSN
nr:outer membrane beta-barrel protein [bacterium]